MPTDKSQPWYKDGLKFKCTGCGDCCTGAPGYVWVNKEEIINLAAQVGLEPAEFESRYVRDVGVRKSLNEHKNGDCVFFDGETAQMPRLPSPPTPVSHLAVLGLEHSHSRSLGTNMPSLPRKRHGSPVPARRDRSPKGRHPPLRPQFVILRYPEESSPSLSGVPSRNVKL